MDVVEGHEDRGIDMEAKLDAAENAVLEIMRTASETMEELENVPDCNVEKLKALAAEYVHLVEEVQTNLKDNPHLIPRKEEEKERDEEINNAIFEKECITLQALIEGLQAENAGGQDTATIVDER